MWAKKNQRLSVCLQNYGINISKSFAESKLKDNLYKGRVPLSMNQDVIHLLQVPSVDANSGSSDTSKKWLSVSIIPKKPYHDGLEVIDDLLRDQLTQAMLNIRRIADNASDLSQMCILVLFDYTEWLVCVEKRIDLAFTEQEVAEYILFLIQENILYAGNKNDASLIVDLPELKVILNAVVKCSLLLKKIDLTKTSLFTKLQLLDIDLKLLRDGKFEHETNVLNRVKRVLHMEQPEFNPNRPIGQQKQITTEDENLSSSPPVDSSDEGDKHESSNSRELLNVNILTQSTQIDSVPSIANKSIESRVDVQATSSSNGHSQQFDNSLKLSNSFSQTHFTEFEASHLKNLASKVQNVHVRNELLQFAENVKAKSDAQKTFTEAYNDTKDAFKLILDNIETFKSVQSNLPTIQSFISTLAFPTVNSNDVSITSTVSSHNKSSEPQEANQIKNLQSIRSLQETIDAETSDRKDSTKLITNYFDKRINNFKVEFKQLKERLRIFEKHQLEFFEFKEFCNGLAVSGSVAQEMKGVLDEIELRMERIEDRNKQSPLDHKRLGSLEETARAASSRVADLESRNTHLEFEVQELNKGLVAVSTAQEMQSRTAEESKKVVEEIDRNWNESSSEFKKIYNELAKVKKIERTVSTGFKNFQLGVETDRVLASDHHKAVDDDIRQLQEQLSIVSQTLDSKVNYDNQYINEKFSLMSEELQKVTATQALLMEKLENQKSQNQTTSENSTLDSSPPSLSKTKKFMSGGRPNHSVSERPLSAVTSHKHSTPIITKHRAVNSVIPDSQSSRSKPRQKPKSKPSSYDDSLNSRISSLLVRKKATASGENAWTNKRNGSSESPVLPDSTEGLKRIKLFKQINDDDI